MENKVNLNTASEQEIKDTLGVDEESARKIVENQPYISWEHFREKTGIGEDKLQMLQEQATIG